MGMMHQFISEGTVRLLFDHNESGIDPDQMSEWLAKNKFASLAESINDTVFTLDSEQRHTGIYGAVLRDYHHTPDMYLGKTVADILGPEASAIHTEANRKALQGQFLTYDWHHDENGQTEWFQTSLAPLVDAAGEVYGIVGVVRNVSELRRAVDDYVRLFNASPLPQWIYRLSDYKFVAVNEAAVVHYGYSVAEFLSMTIMDIRPAEDVALMKGMIDNVDKRDHTIQIGRFTHIKKDGTPIQVHISGHRLDFSGDECAIIVAHDITLNERALTELQIRNADIQIVNRKLNEHRLALDQTANIIITDADGTILEVNDNTCQLSGFSRNELVGQHTRVNKSGFHDDAFYRHMWKTIKGGEIWRDEICNRHKDGSFYWVDTTIVPLLGPDETPHQYLAVRFDITEGKAQEAKLLELNRELGVKAKALSISNAQLEQFAFVVSHDLQEPIRMIVSFLALLKKKYDHELDAKAQSYIDQAIRGAKDMREIIIDLLEYSQIDDRFNAIKNVDLNKLVADVRLLYRRKIEEFGATITVGLLPVIKSYEYPIETVIGNLVDNALQYRHEDRKPEIDISASEDGDHWSISVRDNGIGINPEYFAKIFVIFQRLNARPEHSGTGIGLAIVKKLVDRLGGEITVRSEEGFWTEFTFTVPKVVV